MSRLRDLPKYKRPVMSGSTAKTLAHAVENLMHYDEARRVVFPVASAFAKASAGQVSCLRFVVKRGQFVSAAHKPMG